MVWVDNIGKYCGDKGVLCLEINFDTILVILCIVSLYEIDK